jgi:myxalamid-type polyketide synthase MxaB
VPEAATAQMRALEAGGVQVEVIAVDVADLPLLRQCLQERTGPAVAGVFHLAGVLEDALIDQQNGQRLGLALRPKLAGALALEQALEHSSGAVPLELFVSFTSLAALSGSMGQVAYAAANAALDAYMAQRRCRGLAGLSLQWGPWADAGMAAAQTEQNRQRFASYGIEPIDATAGLVLLGRLLTSDAATRAIMPVNWATYLGQLFAGHPPPLYAEVQQTEVSGESAPAQTMGLAERLLVAAPAQRRALLDEQLKVLVTTILGLPDRRSLGPRQRLFDLGLDSLGAVELRNRLAAMLGRTLRATLLFDYPTLQALGDHIERDVLGLAEQSAVAVESSQAAPVADLSALSDDELANMLAAELGS